MGTEFDRVRFAADAAGTVEQPGQEQSERRRSIDPRHGRRILVVEDDEDTAELMEEALRQFGHEPLVVRDGATALSVSEAHDPSVALIDLGLPEMNGYEVARRLRELPRIGSSLCIIAVTAHVSQSAHERTRIEGFDAHVDKPVDFDALARMLDGALPVRH